MQSAATSASVTSAASSTPSGISASRQAQTTRRCRFSEPTLRSRKRMCATKVERDAAAERDRRHELERLADVAERLLDADREEDDPGDHRQVEVAVRVAGHRAAGRCRSSRAASARRRSRRRRSRPTRARPRPRARAAPPRPRRRRAWLLASSAERDDRLAEGDDHDQRVPLGEVPGGEAPAAAAADVGAEQVERRARRAQTATCRRPSRPAATKRSADADRRPDARAARPPRAGRGRPGRRSRRARGARSARTRTRTRRGTRRRRRRPGTASDAISIAPIAANIAIRTAPFLGVDRVRQPGVGGPRPPEHPEHEQALDEAGPGRVLDDEPGHLREREDEDQVEEELERRHPLLAALSCLSCLDRHGASLSFGMRVLRAAAWAAALSGIPSTAHALATGRDPLEAAYAAGTIVLPRETRPERLLAAGGAGAPRDLARLDGRARPGRRPRRAPRRARGARDRRARPRRRRPPPPADPRAAARARSSPTTPPSARSRVGCCSGDCPAADPGI